MPSLFAPKGIAAGAGGGGTAPSEEDGGQTQQRLLILGSHLFLSLAHVFAVHQSAMDSATGEGRDANATRTYAYSPAMVVFLAEFIKLAFSVSAYVHTHARDTPGNVWGVIRAELEDAAAERRYLRFAVPALIYLIENHLRFVVLSRLASPITWVVFSHVEIPIVAALSFYLLRRKLRRNQWIAVFLLLDGVMAAEIALCHAKGDGDPSHPSCDSFAAYPVVALSLVLLGATLAALAASPSSSCTKSTSRRPFTYKTRSCTRSERWRTGRSSCFPLLERRASRTEAKAKATTGSLRPDRRSGGSARPRPGSSP